MPMSFYLDALFRAIVLALAAYTLVGGRGIKPILRLVRRKRGADLTQVQSEALRWAQRGLTTAVAAGLGALPWVWPAGMPTGLGVLLGIVAGGMATPLHRVVKKRLPERVASLLAGGSLQLDTAQARRRTR